LDPEPGPEPSQTAPADPDAVLVGAAAALVAERLALARALADRYPVLAPGLRPFVALLRAHARVLPPPEEEAAPPVVAGGAREEAVVFGIREARAVRRLARWAVAAESGALARLLASMSAGTAAHLAAADLSEGGVGF
jgi:hypothetical protein